MRYQLSSRRTSMQRFIPASALALLLGFAALPAFAKVDPNHWDYLQPDREQAIASLNVVELLKRHHYNKPPLDDERSVKIYEGYLKTLDPARAYFTAADIAQFDQWRDRFDDFLKSGDLDPAFAMYKLQLMRMQDRLEFALKLLDQPSTFDFRTDETLVVDRDKAAWSKDAAELDDLWRKRVKDEVLRLKIAGKEQGAIKELLTKRYKNQLSRLDQTQGEDVFQAYLNAFAQTYDPHTNYLSPDNAENFDINMSLSLEGIGAVLQSDAEHVKVVRLVPAGPAEKSKQLAPADKIIGVGQGAKGELVDVIGWRLDEVVKLIRGPKGSQVRLEVIPASNAPNDQTSKIVSITREAVKLEEQAAKKSVLTLAHEGRNYKVGVIELPVFYLDFKAYRAGDPDYKSTTRDVKRLLGELEKEKVDGVVIDLRNNGGGSLQEATELTGLFIDKGPTVLVRNSDGRVDVLADEDSGAFYTGPLAVLTNRLSASASEIFAGAMQDYHRALIIGGQTFGKGTVQTIQPLNHGELKLTLAKFYRVSGQSTQHKGVVPDIGYPDVVDTKEIGESALPEAMQYDSINAAISPEKNPFKPFLAELQKRHEERTAHNPDFVFTRERLALAQQLMLETTVSLNETKRRAQHADIEARQLNLENTRRIAKGEEPLKKLKEEDEDALPTEDEKTKPEDDAYLTETGQILLDYLGLNTTVAKH
jgi:carboxyl-terminal processing protease